MNKAELKYKKYSFDLAEPFHISTKTIYTKDVIILRLKSENGIFYGEVSPLIGFSSESIEECEKELIDTQLIIQNLYSYNLPEIHNKYANLPSLLFGIEQLLFASRQNVIFSKRFHDTIKINGIIGINHEDKILADVNALVSNGFDTVKLKIGRPEFEDDLSILRRIDHKFGSLLKIRLDNNGNWKIDEAKRNIEKLLKFNIEYLEQPTENIDDLYKLSEFSNLQIAVDESLDNYDTGSQIIKSGQFKFIVLKPSIKIGLFDTVRLIELSNERDINMIISSAFETAVGRSGLLMLASLTRHNFAHGFNTLLPGSSTIQTEINYHASSIYFKGPESLKFNIKDF